MGENSDVDRGSTLVPDEITPTEFSMAAMPGMDIWAACNTPARYINSRTDNNSFKYLLLDHEGIDAYCRHGRRRCVEVESGAIPLLEKGGGCGISEKLRSHRKAAGG